MTALKPLNPAAVSRLLTRAGFERAEAETTSVRGHYRYSPGFIVQGAKAAYEDGLTDDLAEAAAFVTCQTMNSYDYRDKRPTTQEVEDALVPGYEDALRQAGFDVERVERNDRFRCLRVTRPAPITGEA